MVSEWRKVKINEIAEISRGISWKSSEEFDSYQEGTIRVYKIPHIHPNSRFQLENNKVYIRKPSNYEKYLLEDNDILMVGSNGNPERVGNVVRFKKSESALFASFLLRLRAKEYIDHEFLYYRLLNPDIQNAITDDSAGSTGLRNINALKMGELSIQLPPLNEQRIVVSILSSVDEAIEKTEAIIEQTEKVKKGLMQQLLTKGIGHTKFKKTEIGEIPEDWTIEKLMDISSLMTNGFVGVASPFYSDSEKDSVPYLMSNNIRANRIDLTKLVRITNEFHQQNQKSILQEGDLLTVQSGHIGTSCVVPREFEGANCHALIITRFSDKRVNPYFVSYYLNSQVGMRRLKTIFVGSTVPHINVKDFKKFAVPIPTVEEQNRIVSILQSFDQKIYNEQEKLSKLQLIKKGLMQVLLTGKVRVKVDEEVMSQ